MFLDNIINLINSNPQITMVTERGLETADRKVVFLAKDLDKRYPELKKYFKQDIVIEDESKKEMKTDIPQELAETPIQEEVTEVSEVIKEKPKKKTKKK